MVLDLETWVIYFGPAVWELGEDDNKGIKQAEGTEKGCGTGPRGPVWPKGAPANPAGRPLLGCRDHVNQAAGGPGCWLSRRRGP